MGLKKKSWIYYTFAAVIVIVGVTVAVFFGTKPRAIPKISFSHFETPEDFGANIYKRLRLEVNSHNLLFLGVQADQRDHYLIWKGFLQAIAHQEPARNYIIIADKSLGEIPELVIHETISMQENPQEVIEGIKKIISNTKKAVILGPTSFLSYLINNNFQTLLRSEIYGSNEKVYNVSWLNFSLSPFANNKLEEKLIPFPCNTTPHDLDGSSELGCLILTKSKINYRKKRLPNKYPGMLDQIGTKEYLALFNSKNTP